MNIKIAAQLYSLSTEYESDPRRTLEKIADAGYDGVEFYTYNLPVKELKKILTDLNLIPCASHVQLDRLLDNLYEEIRMAKELGIGTLICPMAQMDELKPDEVVGLSQKLESIAKRLSCEDIRFGYHNHWMEMKSWNGEYIFDVLAAGKENFIMEFDMFWSMVAGINPEKFLNEHWEKCKFIHFKDYIMQPPKQIPKDASDVEKILQGIRPDCFFEQVPVGTGEGRCRELIEMAQDCKVEWMIVEQDYFNMDCFESMERSCQFIRSVLAKGGL